MTKITADLGLGGRVSERAVAALVPPTGLRVSATGEPGLRLGGVFHPLHVLAVGTRVSAAAIESLLRDARAASEDEVLLVGRTLSSAQREVLATDGVSYLDLDDGELHVVLPNAYVHAACRPDRGRRQTTQSLSPSQTRVVQVLLDHPQETWSATELSERAAAWVSDVSRLFARLERLGLVTATGRGPDRRRHVRDRGELLTWLAQDPRDRQRVRQRLRAAVYGRNPMDLLSRVGAALDAHGIAHAWTASAGATVLDAGPTAVPVARGRVHPDGFARLEGALASVRGRVGDRGANVELWSDVGLLGVHDRQCKADLWTAPASRIYVDLQHDPRGEDAAAYFREVVLGY